MYRSSNKAAKQEKNDNKKKSVLSNVNAKMFGQKRNKRWGNGAFKSSDN